MSRRNQARRRRSYGRRQHELRQRQAEAGPVSNRYSDSQAAADLWPAALPLQPADGRLEERP